MSVKQRWWQWHKRNPQVYEHFERLTQQAIGSGCKRLSAWWVVNVLRWELMLKTEGSEFKIPNDFIAYYARLYMHYHPEHEGIFSTRPLRRK